MPWRRIGRLILGVAAFLFMTFCLEILFFRTPLFSKLFVLAFDNQVRVSYSSAWLYWPGSMHARNLELTGEDDSVQWRLTIDRLQFNFSIAAFFKKEFYATQVSAEGVTWVLRSKQFLLDVEPKTLWGRPAIPGFDGIGLKPYGPDQPDADARYQLWTVHLDNVRATQVREIWIDKAHLIGDAELSGGFFLRPLRQLRVMAQLQPKPMTLLIADDVVADQLYGRISVTVQPADLRVGSPSIISEVDASTALTGMLGNLAFLKHMIPPELQLSAVPGPLKLNAVVEQGKLSPASEVDISTPHLHAAKSPFQADSAVRLSLHSSAKQGTRPQADAELELSGLSVGVDKSNAPPLTAKRVRLAVRTLQLDLSKTLAINSAAADIDDLKIPELRLLSAMLPADSKLKIEGGSAELHGHLDSSIESANGEVWLGAHAARFHAADVQLKADARLTVSVRGRAANEGPLDLSGTHLEIDHASVSGAGGEDWFGHFQFPKAALDLTERSVTLEVNARCLDSRPLRALFAVEGVPGFVATFFTMKGLEAKASLHAGKDSIRLTDLDVHGQGASIRANYLVEGEKKRGEALVRVGFATAGLDLDDGKRSVVLAGATSWFEGRTKEAEVAKAAGTSPQR
jgi:hypothetical protein